MGLQLNGNTSVILITLLAACLIGAITAIVVSGHAVPPAFPEALLAVVGIAGGGAVVHQASTVDRRQNVNDVKAVVSDVVKSEVTKQ